MERESCCFTTPYRAHHRSKSFVRVTPFKTLPSKTNNLDRLGIGPEIRFRTVQKSLRDHHDAAESESDHSLTKPKLLKFETQTQTETKSNSKSVSKSKTKTLKSLMELANTPLASKNVQFSYKFCLRTNKVLRPRCLREITHGWW